MTFKKIFSAFVATSVLVTTAFPASAESFFFRYNTSVVEKISPEPETPAVEEYGVGNDIVAYYVAPVGVEFSKKLPVATQDVVDWRMDEGRTPDGISIGRTNGVLSGIPAVEEQRKVLFRGYDRAGNRIARAEVNFTVFEPRGVASQVDFYAHVGSYFYSAIPVPADVTVHTWVPIADMAPGMQTLDAAYQGTPEKAGSYGVAWRGFDYFGREVAYAYGDLLVETGPVVEEMAGGSVRRLFADQAVERGKGEQFGVQATVRKSLGKISYRLIPSTVNPSGLAFSQTAGSISGVFKDFDTSATYRIQARDSYDGTTGFSNPFKLTTLPASADLASLKDLHGIIGEHFFKRLTTSVLAPGATWALQQGSLPKGVSLDGATGIISGTPTEVVDLKGLVLAVSGPGTVSAQSDPIGFRVHAEKLGLETTPLHVRVNKGFSTAGVKIGSGSGGKIAIEADAPDGVVLDKSSGALSSQGVAQAGSLDTLLQVSNEDNQSSVWQVLRVYNELGVSYENQTVVRHQPIGFAPTVADDSIIGTAAFELLDADGNPTATPSWLAFNKNTGGFWGRPFTPDTADKTYGPFKVKISDDSSSTVSNPFTIHVVQRPDIALSVAASELQQYVPNASKVANVDNAIGNVTYTAPTLPANWPATLKIGSDGWLSGTTNDPVGTVYAGITVKAADADGFAKTSDPFQIVVTKAADLAPLAGSLDVTVPWTIGQPLSSSLPAIANGFGALAYNFASPSYGFSIMDASTGAFAGTPLAVGDQQIAYTVKDNTERAPAAGTLTLRINDYLNVTTEESYSVNRASQIVLAVKVTGGTQPFVYRSSGAIPRGVSFLNGVYSGVPEVEGRFPLTVSVTDAAGASSTTSFVLDVTPPKAIVLAYPDSTMFLGQYKFLYPSVENAIGSVKWDAPSGTMPPGVGFDATNGAFVGAPMATGVWQDIVAGGRDSDGRPFSTKIDITVTRSGPVDFAPYTFKHRLDKPFSDRFAATNTVDPTRYTAPSGLPGNLVLDGVQGTITGSLPEAGTHVVDVLATDSVGRSAPSTVTFDIVGKLQVAANDVQLSQFQIGAGSPPSVANALGSVTYSLVGGSLPSGVVLDPVTGVIQGTPSVDGTFTIAGIQATDDVDGEVARTKAITIEVLPRPQLDLALASAYTAKRYESFTISPVTTGAILPAQYQVVPALPLGFALDPASGVISGISDDVVANATYTLSAVDAKGGAKGSDSVQFDLAVADRDALGISMADVVAKRYGAISPVSPSLDNVIGGASYSVAPALPSGIVLDPATGTVSGSSNAIHQTTAYTLTATDSKGGTRGTASANFNVTVVDRDALEVDGPSSVFLAQYLGGDATFAAKNAIGQANYSISPTLPSGLALDPVTGILSGSSSQLMEPTPFVVTVADDHDAASKTVTIEIGPRKPLEIATPAVQTMLLDHPYSLTLDADNVVGTLVTWKMVSGALPQGVGFDAATGTFSGVPKEYGKTATVVIEAADAFGGSDRRTFSLTAIQDGTPLALSAWGSTTRVGHPFTVRAPALANVVGNVVWSASIGSSGLVVDPKTGQLSGTPKSVFNQNVVLTATDSTGRKADAVLPFVSAPTMALAPSAVISAEYNRALSYQVGPTLANSYGALTWSASGPMPKGVSFDPVTGEFKGLPGEIGTFGPIVVTASDTLPGSATASVTIRAVMNGDPISLEVFDLISHVGHPFATDIPKYGNELGSVRFFSSDAASHGMSVDPSTGVLSGPGQSVADVYVNVAIGDDGTTRVTTKPARIQIIPGLRMTVPAQLSVMQGEAESLPITTVYGIGKVSFAKGGGAWPQGVDVDPDTGSIVGRATALVGTYPGLTIKGTDTFNGGLTDVQQSNAFSIKVGPTDARPVISDVPSTAANKAQLYTAGSAMSFTPTVIDDKYGLPWAFAGTTYALSADLSGTGLTFDKATGTISGTPSKAFYFADLQITVTSVSGDEDVTSPFWFGVQPSGPIAPEAGQVTTYNTRVDAAVSIPAPKFNNTFGSVRYSKGGTAPGSLAVNPATGAVTGTPVTGQNGTFTLAVVVTDEFGRQGQITYDIVISPPLVVTMTQGVGFVAGIGYSNVSVASASGVSGTASWNVTGLPTGLTFNATTGRVGGTVNASIADRTVFSVTATVTDTHPTLGVSSSSGTVNYTVYKDGAHRYFRVSYVSGGATRMHEIEPLLPGGEKVGGYSVSGQTAAADGNPDTSASSTGNVVFTFGTAMPIRVFDVLTYNGSSGNCNSAKEITVAYSDNGSTWTTAKVYSYLPSNAGTCNNIATIRVSF